MCAARTTKRVPGDATPALVKPELARRAIAVRCDAIRERETADFWDLQRERLAIIWSHSNDRRSSDKRL